MPSCVRCGTTVEENATLCLSCAQAAVVQNNPNDRAQWLEATYLEFG